MKKIVALILVLAMAFSLCACVSEETRLKREAEQAQKDYQNTLDRMEELEREHDKIQDLLS